MRSVTLTRPASTLTSAQSWTVDYVLERAVRNEDVLRYSITAVGVWKIFHLWVDNLSSGVEPAIGWTITDDLGDTYDLKQVEFLTRRTRYKCLGLRKRS